MPLANDFKDKLGVFMVHGCYCVEILHICDLVSEGMRNLASHSLSRSSCWFRVGGVLRRVVRLWLNWRNSKPSWVYYSPIYCLCL